VPNYLLTKDWKVILAKSEHKTVKKTGISDALDEYASAVKKDDLDKIATTLTLILTKAGQVKTAQSKFPIMTGYLDEMIKAAKVKKTEIDKRLEAEGAGPFAKELKLIKQVGADNAWHFVFAPGKPAGFIVSKKPIRKDDIEEAHKMRGQKGVFHTGDIYFDQGKYIMTLEARPPSGLAKGAVNAAKVHAKMKIAVIIMGGGVTLDSDTDLDPDAESPGLGAPQQQQGQTTAQVHAQRVTQLADALLKAAALPGSTVEGALDGLKATAERLREQILADKTLDPQVSVQLQGRLDQIRKDIQSKTDSGKPDPMAKYATLEQWTREIGAVQQLDPARHNDAWARMMKKQEDAISLFEKDTELSDQQGVTVLSTLRKALEMITDQREKSEKLRTSRNKSDDPALTRKFLALERKLATVRRGNLPVDLVDKIVKVFDSLRQAYIAGDFDFVRNNIDRVDAAIEKQTKVALQNIQTTHSRLDQAEMHRTLAPSMEFLKKAAFTPGMIKDQASLRDAMKSDPDLVQMIKSGAEVTKNLDENTLKQLESTARKVLEGVASRKPPPPSELMLGDQGYDENNPNKQYAPPDPSEDHSLPGDKLSEEMAQTILRNANMARLALQYEALGAPPWDEAKTDLASELQAQLFFLESAVANKQPNYQAPSTSGDGGGASGSWWIERSETTVTDDNTLKTGQKKRYIFKPATREAAVMSGLPPGSGAPREVLAKKLDDMMAGAGFQVGVSPTTLASLDGSSLGGDMDPKSGPQLGSMQRLANTSLALGESDTDTIAKVDKRSFDDVAVFDMIFANFDRHAKNVLLEKDDVTGKHKLVPIDHGSSLGDPDVIFANRSSLLPPANIMADPAIPQSLEPLSDETLESLARLDPDEMVREMKKQRSGMELRHPGAKGMIDDAAIDAMAARVRFLKEIGSQVPVGEVFTILAYGAKRIADCAPNDVPALVKTLISENAKRTKAKEGTAIVSEYLKSQVKVKNESNISNAVSGDLTALGWCYAANATDKVNWIKDNPVLVERIYKTRMVNPEAIKELNRLLPLARQINPKVDENNRQAKRNLGEAISYLTSVINEKQYAVPKASDLPTDAAKQEFINLGGDKVLNEALSVFPGSGERLSPWQDDLKENAKQAHWASRVLMIRMWNEFNSLGGVKEFLRLGCEIPRDFKLLDGIGRLREVKAGEQTIGDLMSKSDQDIDIDMVKNYETVRDSMDVFAQKLRSPENKNEARQRKADAILAWQNDEKLKAVAILARGKMGLESETMAQDFFDENAKKSRQDFARKLNDEAQGVKLAFEDHRQRIETDLDTAFNEADTLRFAKLMREADLRLDAAKLGDQAPLTKATAKYDSLIERLKSHAGKPWHGNIQTAVTGLKSTLDGFSLESFDNQTKFVVERFDAADKIDVVLKGRNVSLLPQALQTEFATWLTNIQTGSSLNRIDEFIDKLGKALVDA
jgi:hypothetical protein